jgi:hypothetical protein
MKVKYSIENCLKEWFYFIQFHQTDFVAHACNPNVSIVDNPIPTDAYVEFIAITKRFAEPSKVKVQPANQNTRKTRHIMNEQLLPVTSIQSVVKPVAEKNISSAAPAALQQVNIALMPRKVVDMKEVDILEESEVEILEPENEVEIVEERDDDVQIIEEKEVQILEKDKLPGVKLRKNVVQNKKEKLQMDTHHQVLTIPLEVASHLDRRWGNYQNLTIIIKLL